MHLKNEETKLVSILNGLRIQTFHLAGNTKISFNTFKAKYWPLPGDTVELAPVKESEKMTKEDAQQMFLRLTGKQ